MIEIIKDIAVAVGVPVARSVSGWLKHALEDKKITKFEFKQLIDTVVRVGLQGLMIYLGLNELGFDISVLGASAGAYIVDIVIRALKKK